MKFNQLFVGIVAFASLVSCSSSDDKSDVKDPTTGKNYYNVIWCDSDEGNTGSYTQALENILTGDINFTGKGFEIPSVRSAYVFASSNGEYLYSYSYGGGTLSKFKVQGGSTYTQEGTELNLTPFTGSEYSRCSKLTDALASCHNVKTENVIEGGTYLHTKATLKLATINLQDMLIAEEEEIEIPQSEFDIANKTYVWRVHMPVIHQGKIYYGIARRRQNPSNPTEADKTFDAPAGVLVMDYPGLTNIQVLETSVEEAIAETYGFRSCPLYADEKGDLYQLSMDNSHILRLKNGSYDNSFVFKLQDALSSTYRLSAAGWFYAGNGIGYVPFEEEKGDGGNNWGLARVDLNTKTAVRMNIPTNMDMWEYQSVRFENGKMLMAICPVDGDGHIYSFDVASTSPDAFTKGASIKGGVDAYYAGIF